MDATRSLLHQSLEIVDDMPRSNSVCVKCGRCASSLVTPIVFFGILASHCWQFAASAEETGDVQIFDGPEPVVIEPHYDRDVQAIPPDRLAMAQGLHVGGNSEVTQEAVLRLIPRMLNLRSLSFDGRKEYHWATLTLIADPGKLRFLNVRGVKLNEEGVAFILTCKSLINLDVRGTGISDADVGRLRNGLTALRWLGVDRGHATQ